MDKNTLIERVKKCLALAQSCEPHEAAQAIKKAQLLMAKYGITNDDVALSKVKRKTSYVNATLKAPAHLRYLVAMLCAAFGCDAIYHPRFGPVQNKNAVSVSFIGFDPNPQLAGYAFDVLRKQLVEGRKLYLTSLHRNCIKATKTRRANLWAEAWVYAANQKVAKLTLNQEQHRTLEKWIKKNYDTLSQTKARMTKTIGDRGDLAAVCDGTMAGDKASLYSPVYGEGKGPKALGNPGSTI